MTAATKFRGYTDLVYAHPRVQSAKHKVPSIERWILVIFGDQNQNLILARVFEISRDGQKSQRLSFGVCVAPNLIKKRCDLKKCTKYLK